LHQGLYSVHKHKCLWNVATAEKFHLLPALYYIRSLYVTVISRAVTEQNKSVFFVCS
jgi:hypothetical protein